MYTPKMLPFLASTAGIELERAEALWQQASDYAAKVAGESENAHYLGLAHEQMVALVEKEVLAANPVSDAPWLMIQAHVSVAPMLVADLFTEASHASRQLLNRWKTGSHTTA